MSDETPDAYDREEWQSEVYRDDADDRPTPYRELSRRERDVLFAVARAVGASDHRHAESISAVTGVVFKDTASSPDPADMSNTLTRLEDAQLVERRDSSVNGTATQVRITDAGLWALAEGRDELQRAIREVVDSDE